MILLFVDRQNMTNIYRWKYSFKNLEKSILNKMILCFVFFLCSVFANESLTSCGTKVVEENQVIERYGTVGFFKLKLELSARWKFHVGGFLVGNFTVPYLIIEVIFMAEYGQDIREITEALESRVEIKFITNLLWILILCRFKPWDGLRRYGDQTVFTPKFSRFRSILRSPRQSVLSKLV